MVLRGPLFTKLRFRPRKPDPPRAGLDDPPAGILDQMTVVDFSNWEETSTILFNQTCRDLVRGMTKTQARNNLGNRSRVNIAFEWVELAGRHAESRP